MGGGRLEGWANISHQLISQVKERIEPVWMDLAYVPHHGSSSYTTSEFFKRVRARYYVFSGTDPSREVFDALIEAKKTWENKDQGPCSSSTVVQ